MTTASLYEKLRTQVRNVTASTFEATALAIFQYQYENNLLYQQFVDVLGISPASVARLETIPCLPIPFFKYHTIHSEAWVPEGVFSSSGTTGQRPSRHIVRDLDWYREHAYRNFEAQYGPLSDYVVLALLPSYLERRGSSLVFMAEQFVQRSGREESGFFLHNTEELVRTLDACEAKGQPVLLLGVTYALLDLAEAHARTLRHTIIMETGGMKGRRAEMTKAAIHQQLQDAFDVPQIHAEYGMTELLSQAYSSGKGIFEPGDLMRVYIRDLTDPLTPMPDGRSGSINVIDLANLATCSFVATDDLGRRLGGERFEVLGRVDASEWRGCNLMLSDL